MSGILPDMGLHSMETDIRDIIIGVNDKSVPIEDRWTDKYVKKPFNENAYKSRKMRGASNAW